MSKKKGQAKVPFADMLAAIDRCDFDFYSRLTQEQKKAFSAWLAMRAASSAKGTDAYHYLLMVNDIVNVDFSSLTKHPELQWKLLATCGIGHKTYHPWLAPSKKQKVSKVEKFLQDRYPELSRQEIELLTEINDEATLRMLAEDHGYEDKDIEDLFK